MILENIVGSIYNKIKDKIHNAVSRNIFDFSKELYDIKISLKLILPFINTLYIYMEILHEILNTYGSFLGFNFNLKFNESNYVIINPGERIIILNLGWSFYQLNLNYNFLYLNRLLLRYRSQFKLNLNLINNPNFYLGFYCSLTDWVTNQFEDRSLILNSKLPVMIGQNLDIFYREVDDQKRRKDSLEKPDKDSHECNRIGV